MTMKKAILSAAIAAAGLSALALPTIGQAVAAPAPAEADAAALQHAADPAAEQARLRSARIAAEMEALRVREAAQLTLRASAMEREADDLRPGSFLWEPELSRSGPVEVVVSIPQQRAYVYRGGTLIGVSTVSTGRRGHETPTGSFSILQKRPRHFSNLYNNAPMPYMQRLTWDGIALHAGQIPGHPASHGCVRLPLAFAQHLFGATRIGAQVHILRASPAPREALALAHGRSIYNGMGGPEERAE
jgi:lipoprotein-anchoring transpeptidase ErfK/SrfK